MSASRLKKEKEAPDDDKGLKKALCPALAIPDDPSVRVSPYPHDNLRVIICNLPDQCGSEGSLELSISYANILGYGFVDMMRPRRNLDALWTTLNLAQVV